MRGQTHSEVARRDRAIFTAFSSGASVEQLCDVYGVRPYLVRRVLRARGVRFVNPRNSHPENATRDQFIAALRRQGVALADIAQAFGLCARYVSNIVSSQRG